MMGVGVLAVTVAAHDVRLFSNMLPVIKASLKGRRSALDSRLEELGAIEKTCWKLFSEVETEARLATEKIEALLAYQVSVADINPPKVLVSLLN